MADSATVRISGPVIGLDIREGNAKSDGRPYRIVTARVLVDEGIAEAVLPSDIAEPSRGDIVDWIADVSMDVSQRYGANLRIRVRSVYVEPVPAHAI